MHQTLIEQSVGVWPQIAVFTIYIYVFQPVHRFLTP